MWLKKVCSGMYALNALKFFMPSHILRTMYYALLHSHFTYGCLLWGNSYKKYVHKLKVLQKKAVRIICHASYNATSSPLFKKTGILKLDDLHKLQTCQFMHKLYNRDLPRPLVGLIPQNLDIHNRLTRHRRNYLCVLYRNHTVQNSFLVEGPKLWNVINDNIKDYSYRKYSREMKTSYLSSY